ncbi:bifunctional 3'-5' exonuclease/ATP-dependent helicase WRN-like [Mercenaria mercenaria]|uniref:bifunctional 3'-5' exonuclease/ATP-dependent helicase WRN-like n=1 Tax=Mercenaria mercenaria TaxID=6596 RepID=UPI00234F9387|nr:bifunctional 3'-5' exonuclease/ATP-dependent helicase WRN-like [Mercenaria mercenaria]
MATIDELLHDALKKFKIDKFKPEQRIIFDAIWSGKDCVGVLPTGFGKSLPYQVLSLVERKWNGSRTVPSPKIIVCCPLISLMMDQVGRLREIPDVSAFYLGESEESDLLIKEGKFDYLFGSPEHLVGDDSWRNVIKTFNVSTIVVDEFHTITSWDEDDTGKAFRKWFSHLWELRSFFPSASILALSATCKKSHYKKVMKTLNMKGDTVIVKVSPNRSNIKMLVHKVISIENDFLKVVDALQENMMPRTLIYCSSIKDVSLIYNYLTSEAINTLTFIGMYHSETPSKNKEEILDKLKEHNGNFVIIATNALGMGIDIVNCNNVIIYGAPYTVTDFWQQVGRIGRDGSNSTAILAYNSYHLRSADEDVKMVFKTKSCRRMAAISEFLTKKEQKILRNETGNHLCCDFCEKSCTCGKCSSTSLEKLFMSNNNDIEHENLTDNSSTISYEYSDPEYDFSDWEMEELSIY